jgi:hypothetical protein
MHLKIILSLPTLAKLLADNILHEFSKALTFVFIGIYIYLGFAHMLGSMHFFALRADLIM